MNTVIYYAPTIFKFAGFQSTGASILAAVGLGVVMLWSHVAAIFLIDRVSRRLLLLVGRAGQVVGLATLGAAFHFKQLSSSVGDLAVGSLVVYVACFAFGLGPVFWLLISEIYPLAVRGTAMSVATVAKWAMNLAVAVTFLTLVAGHGWLVRIDDGLHHGRSFVRSCFAKDVLGVLRPFNRVPLRAAIVRPPSPSTQTTGRSG